MRKLTKCPNCGGGLSFNPKKQAIWCEHCESYFDINVTNKNAKLIRKYTVDFTPEIYEEESNQYKCESCGSLYFNDGENAYRCPNCASVNVQPVQSAVHIPDGIIPFTLNKVDAQQIFEKWISKRKFAPSNLKAMAKHGKVSSVYVPVYNINATNVCFYNGTVKKVHTDNTTNTIFSTVHTVRDVLTTKIENNAICANKVLDGNLISKIANIDTSKIVPYSSDYLFGYAASDTNYSIHDAIQKLKENYQYISENQVRNKLKSKYDEIVNLTCESRIENIVFSYTYMPVFMNHYTYKNKNYHCYINGTTGAVSGKSPKSVGKILGLIGGVLGVIGIIAGIVVAVL